MAKVHLTKSIIEGIEPGEKKQHFTDDSHRGLTLTVTPGGIKTFFLTKKFRGKTERSLLGHFPEMSLSEAKKKSAYYQVQYDAGINPNEARRQSRAELTLDEYFDIYYEDHCKLKTKRPKAIKANYELYLQSSLGKTQLSKIVREDIKAIMRKLGNEGHTRTANVAHGLIRSMLNKALAWEYLKTGTNPAIRIERFPEPVRKRYLQEDELPRFHAALLKEPSETNRDAVLLLLYTGVRSINVFSMHWSEVDLEQGLWLIPKTKNGEPHMTVLTDEAVAVLRRRKKKATSVFVLPGTGKTGHVEGIRKAWQRVLDCAGIDDLWIHDLRRTMGSYMANSGAHPIQISMQLGHKDIQSSLAYVHADLKYTRSSVESVTKRLANKEVMRGE